MEIIQPSDMVLIPWLPPELLSLGQLSGERNLSAQKMCHCFT